MTNINQEHLRVLSAVCNMSHDGNDRNWVERTLIWYNPLLHPQLLESGKDMSIIYKRHVAKSIRILAEVKLVTLTRTHVRATYLGAAINDQAQKQRDVRDH